MTLTGLPRMLRVQWRTHRRGTIIWVLVLAASMVGTAASIASLYDTPAKIHTYAAAVTSGDSLVAINGRVEGIDSLGGVIQDEFGFLASFLMPLLGIALVARATRREEESGRLEALLAGRVSRPVPTRRGAPRRRRAPSRSPSSSSPSGSSGPGSRGAAPSSTRLPRRCWRSPSRASPPSSPR